jgi:hypothetical protein
MEKKIEIVYYQLWSKNLHAEFMGRLKMSESNGGEFLHAINIEMNNKMFLAELDDNIIKGNAHFDRWISELLSLYVKRCSLENGDTPYLRKYYTDWLNNTKLIIKNNYPYVYEWCLGYEKYISKE